jgi:hypothetical protein
MKPPTCHALLRNRRDVKQPHPTPFTIGAGHRRILQSFSNACVCNIHNLAHVETRPLYPEARITIDLTELYER